MASLKTIPVEVAYALPADQLVISMEVEEGATVEQAIRQSGILNRFPDIDLAVNKVGVYGKASKLSNPLRAGDRVEIYRALIADPKEARKNKAGAGKAGAEDAD